MALQSSGQISLEDIADELGESLTNISLGDMSNDVGFTDPDAISEFYGYSATTAFTFLGSTRQNSSSIACFFSASTTYYHNNGSGGAGTYVAVNDYVYSDSGLSNKLTGGYYKVNTPSFDWIRVNGFGRVFQTGICD